MAGLNPPYVMKKFSLDNSVVNKFLVDRENRRMIRGGKVKEILKGLNEKIHFNSPFVVNEKNGCFNLIDGNHRFEAIKLKLAQDKSFKICVWVATYRNLTKEEERKIFKLWNIGLTQSATDFLKLYFNTIPLGSEMLRRLPVSIYGDKVTLNIKLLVGSHLDAKRQGFYAGGYGAGKEQTISDFSEVTLEDIETISEFYSFMKECFGEFDRENSPLFYKSTPLSSFYRIWYDNRVIGKENLIKIFTRIFTSRVGIWKDSISIHGRMASIVFYKTAIESLNSLQRRYKFLSDKEIVPNKEKEKKILAIAKIK